MKRINKLAENIGVSTEALIKVIDAVNSKCPHDFGVPKDYEIIEGGTICEIDCDICWKTVIDKMSAI